MSHCYLLNDADNKNNRICLGSGVADQLSNDVLFEEFKYILDDDVGNEL